MARRDLLLAAGLDCCGVSPATVILMTSVLMFDGGHSSAAALTSRPVLGVAVEERSGRWYLLGSGVSGSVELVKAKALGGRLGVGGIVVVRFPPCLALIGAPLFVS